jgi:DhnA family fructose-bisphosphate aldolase class Ia
VIKFIFMLTHEDRTVEDALEVYRDVRRAGLRYVGFKDVGASLEQLRSVADAAHEDGLEVMLEVVSTSADDELRSVEAAAAIGVDWVLGGTHAESGAEVVIAGTGLRYCPFPGTVVGHPSVLMGEIAEIAEIAESARRLTAMEGVYGLDLLAYRHATADVPDLVRAVVAASSGHVIAAGSVATLAQIATLNEAGAWGFTIGGTVFEGRLPGGPSVDGQVRAVLAALGGPLGTAGDSQAGSGPADG